MKQGQLMYDGDEGYVDRAQFEAVIYAHFPGLFLGRGENRIRRIKSVMFKKDEVVFSFE